MHWAILLFHHYISREKFIVRSDCKALEWLKTAPLNDIVTKWHTRLQHYDFDVVHRPGAKSQNVDGLTRQPIVDASCYGVEPLPVLDNIKPRNITIRAVQTRRATVREKPARVLAETPRGRIAEQIELTSNVEEPRADQEVHPGAQI